MELPQAALETPATDARESDATASPLFRDEAVAARDVGWLEEVMIARPLSFRFLASFAGLAGAAIVQPS
jgi:hypothetical protein